MHIELLIFSQGLHLLQGSYPWAMRSSLEPLYSCLLDSLISSALEQDGSLQNLPRVVKA